jgi:hypothetical protein
LQAPIDSANALRVPAQWLSQAIASGLFTKSFRGTDLNWQRLPFSDMCDYSSP